MSIQGIITLLPWIDRPVSTKNPTSFIKHFVVFNALSTDACLSSRVVRDALYTLRIWTSIDKDSERVRENLGTVVNIGQWTLEDNHIGSQRRGWDEERLVGSVWSLTEGNPWRRFILHEMLIGRVFINSARSDHWNGSRQRSQWQFKGLKRLVYDFGSKVCDCYIKSSLCDSFKEVYCFILNRSYWIFCIRGRLRNFNILFFSDIKVFISNRIKRWYGDNNKAF